MTNEQIERQRARWRRAKAAQRARKAGQPAPVTPMASVRLRGPVTPVLRVSVDWRDRGICQGADPRVFDGETAEDVAAAKRICAACPVRAECLRFATEVGTGYGVWGGVHLGVETAAVAS